jgi:hypothetical protein
VSFGSRQQSALQQFSLIIKAPATVISIIAPCIIVCSGSRKSKESVYVFVVVVRKYESELELQRQLFGYLI